MERVEPVLRSILQITLSFAMNLYSIPAHVVWMTLLTPLRFVSWGRHIYWSCEAFLFNGLLSMVTTWFRTCGYDIIEMGDDVSSLYDKRVLLMANHQSTADVPTIMAATHLLPGVGGRTYWIMDYIFRYTHFGLVSTIRSDFFIREGKKHRDSQLVQFRDHLRHSFIRNNKGWLILFPEGGFLRKRREVSKSYARKNSYPVLDHVTLPRTGALQIILDTLVHAPQNGSTLPGDTTEDTNLDWLVDLTIAYPDGKPLDVIDILSAWHPPCEVICHYRAYPTSEIPRDTQGMTTWLFARYQEKHDMLDHFYTHGKFPDESGTVRTLPTRQTKPLTSSWAGLLLYHAFYISSTYLQLMYVYRPLYNLVTSVFS